MPFPISGRTRRQSCNRIRPGSLSRRPYGWQLPHVFADFLRRSSFSGSREAYFVLTCGSDIACAGEGIEKLCHEIGFAYRGVLEVVMPENYIVMFRAPEEQQAHALIEAARPCIESGIACIRRGENFPRRKTSLLDRIKSGPVNQGHCIAL